MVVLDDFWGLFWSEQFSDSQTNYQFPKQLKVSAPKYPNVITSITILSLQAPHISNICNPMFTGKSLPINNLSCSLCFSTGYYSKSSAFQKPQQPFRVDASFEDVRKLSLLHPNLLCAPSFLLCSHDAAPPPRKKRVGSVQSFVAVINKSALLYL